MSTTTRMHRRQRSAHRNSEVNINSSWVNYKGAWAIHLFLIVAAKIVLSSVPFLSTETSWTLTLLTYNAACFLAFHWAIGVPFDFSQGKYDELTFWEQIDGGEHWTSTKKFLMLVPVALFLISTHYSRFSPETFAINFISTAIVLIAKQPVMHKRRLFGINEKYKGVVEPLE